MRIKIKKQIALVLAMLLFLSPLSETRLYAAETAETSTSEEFSDKTQNPTDEEVSSETPGNIQEDAEAENNDNKANEDSTESVIEKESESISETKSEQKPETEDNAETDTVEEDDSERGFESDDKAEKPEETDYPCPEALEPENVPYDENQEEFTAKLIRSSRARSTMPAKYDAREEGYMPAIRDQGSWQTCWSFSLTGAMEVSMIRDMSAVVDSVDLSERHLAYFGFNTGYDALDNANGDTMTSPASYYLNNGGNDLRGVIRLMNWNGGAKEDDYPYSTSSLPDALERTTAQDAAVYLENAYRYDFASAIVDETGAPDADKKSTAIQVVKKMIRDYGAVSWSYYHAGGYFGSDKKSYYNYAGGTAEEKTNHAVMAVGWDDNYAKENFAEGHQPQNDGAWIIRNSWGKTCGEEGYMYISYEDVSLGSANPVYAVTTCDASKYDNNYFYGNTAFSTSSIAVRRAAQVYKMKSEKAVREKLTAVSLLIGTSDVDYELQVYKNPNVKDGIVTNPTSGTPMLDTPQTGTLGYAGLHTITFDTPLVFDADDNVSVVLTFPETKPNMYFDRSYTSDKGQQRGVHIVTKGQSFYGSSLTSWQDDSENNRTFRINALTVDCDDVEEVPEIKEISVTEAQNFNELPKVDITWSKCTGVDSYKIYRAEESGAYELAGTVDSSARKYTDTLPERKAAQYHYKIAAVYGSSEKLSEAAKIKAEGTVGGSKLTFSDYDSYTAVLSWDKTAGAEGYELWGLLSGEKDYVHIADFEPDDALSYTVSTDDWGQYYYRVRAKQSDTYTDWSKVCINKDLLWKQRDYYSAHFEWQSVQGAVSYKLWHRANGKTFSFTTNNISANLSMKSANYLPCDEHQYYVEAYDAADAGGNKIYTSSTITFKMTPDAPTIDTVAYDYENYITLAWSGVAGVDRIKVYRSEASSETGSIVAEVSADALSYTDNVRKGKTYHYTLIPVAVNHKSEPVEGQSVKSEEITTFPDAVTLDTAQYIAETGVELAWNAAKGADGYIVERSDNDGDFAMLSVIEDGTATAYTDETAKKGNTYRYRMMSYFLAEDESRSTLPVQNEIEVAIVLVGLGLSVEHVELLKDTEQEFRIIPAPAYYPYKQDLVWSACDEKGRDLSVINENDTTVIYGIDGKKILYISDNKIYALRDSDTTKITLTATVDIISAECKIFVYSSDFWVSGVKDFTYTGAAIKQTIDVYDGKLLLTEGEDYTVTYKNNVKVSVNETNLSKKPQVIVKGKGSYTGTQTMYFEILPEAAENAEKISVLKAKVSSIGTQEYQGSAIEPKPVVKYGRDTLTEGTDYTLSYENNNGAGTAAVIISGINDYKGTNRVNFKINYNLQNDSSGLIRVEPDKMSVPYKKGGAKPVPKVYCGSSLLKEGTDYKLSYKNNKAIADASDKKAPTIIITGKGDYKGKKEVSFNIVQQDIGTLTLTAKDKVYTGKAGNFTTSFVITDKDGKKLSAGKDYDKKSAIYTYADTGKPVMSTDIVPKGTKLRITVNAAASGTYGGTISGEYRISSYDIGKAKVTVDVQTYTGDKIEPNSATGVKVSYKGYADGLTEGIEYEIIGYDNNIEKGTAKLYIKGIGDFCGTKTVKFKIKTKIFKWWN